MRVIAGEFRSRRLKTVPGAALRPTPDLLREALFSVLAPEIEGTVFVDAYAGSGAVGIEALSRGAARAIFIEKHPAAVNVIRENLAALSIAGRATVVRGLAAAMLSRYAGDIVFIDPPYPLEREYGAALRVLGQKPPRLALVQHSKHFKLEEAYGQLRTTRVLAHGDNLITFFR